MANDMMQLTREKTVLMTAFKDMKRPDLQALCKTHNIKGITRAKNLLEASLVEHCIAEHAGRVFNLAKCDKAGLNASTVGRPLVPQKRANDDTTQAAPKRRVEGGLASSTATARPALTQSQTSNAPTLRSLQANIEDILSRLSNPSMTEVQVADIVEAKLAEQREQFQTALDELHTLCRVGFTNMQASFDAIGDWRDEVTNTFNHIQSWAADVEQKIVGKAPSAIPKHIVSQQRRSTSHLSSTPGPSAPPSQCQTPAMPPIHIARRRSGRISDASEFSLATIPEQPGTPMGEEQEGEEEDASVFQQPASKPLQVEQTIVDGDSEYQETRAAKHVRISSPEVEESQQDEGESTAGLLQENSVPSVFRQLGMHTPAASKTLFGTECSTEERFDDAAPLDEQAGGVDTKLPSWTNRSPSWFRKVVTTE